MKFGKKLFAYCVTSLRTYEQASLANFLINEASKIGAIVYIFNQQDADCSHDVMRLINFDETDGIIIDTKTFHDNNGCIPYILCNAKEHNTPVIAIDSDLDGCIKLSYDYGTAFEELVEHLITVHGCRRIDMIAGIEGNTFSESRINAYKTVLEKHGVPFRKERLVYGDFWHDPAVISAEKLLADPDYLPDAIVCVNDSTAIAACEVINRHGYSVPDDILVTGFDGIEESRLHFPNITTAEQNLEAAAAAMISTLDGVSRGIAPKDICIPFSLRFTHSCGCSVTTDLDKNTALLTLTDRLDSAYGFDLHMIHFGDRLIAARTWEEISDVIGKFSFMNSLVCINRSFFDFSTELPSNAEKPFDDELNIVCHKGLENEFFSDKSVRLSELVPEHSENPKVADTSYVINAIRFGDITLGYVALPTFSQWHLLYRYSEKYVATLAQAAIQINMRGHMKFLFFHDPLTGLNNRRGFFDAMKTLISRDSDGRHILNIYSLDMNDLKYINDTFGHSDGDFAIKTMANALIAAAEGSESYTARFGGDEFVVAIVTTDADDGGRYGMRFREILNELSEGAEKPYKIVASCGFSHEVITDSLLIDELIRRSDVLMYMEKSNYKRSRSRENDADAAKNDNNA